MGRLAPATTDQSHPLPTRRSREEAIHSLVEVLLANRHRVLGRRELSRLIGVADLNERRCDSLLVDVRRVLGTDAVVTVRSRGWMLAPSAVAPAEALVACRHEAHSR